MANPFDAVTNPLSAASSILNQLQGLNNGQWDIQESAYGHAPSPLVVFHVFKSSQDYKAGVEQVQDSVSRRLAIFEFPYVDGQTTSDLGRNGESFDFDILIHGDKYYSAYVALEKEFNNPLPGTLIHPVRGPMTVKFKEATVTHHSQKRKAVTIRARFVEHSFEASFQAAPKTTKSALADAVAFLAKIDSAITAIESNVFTAAIIIGAISAAVKSFQSDYQGTLVALNTTFNHGSSADIPGLLPTNSNAFPTASSPTDPFAGLTPSEIQAIQSPALASLQAVDRVKNNRDLANSAIALMESANNGLGALDFFDQVQILKQSAISLQSALELALQSSNATIVPYTVPSTMGLREVCFANGLAVDRAYELEQLNPQLLSTNLIPAGTILQVPSS